LNNLIKISPYDKTISITDMENIFCRGNATYETIFRRLEFNQVIIYTKGIGIDIGCGLNKIHSGAIGIDSQLSENDYGYPLGANIKCEKQEEYLPLPWFVNESLDFVFASHSLEHFSDPQKWIEEVHRVLKPNGYLILILPNMNIYPITGSSGANRDHQINYYPHMLPQVINPLGKWDTVQLDTLHVRLNNVELTERDRKIAAHYGHKTLNFSFDAVFRKQ
jgi:SAM-dependent methyltransferase